MFETLYRVLYWNRNELQLISVDHPHPAVIAEIHRITRAMDYLQARLGYMPAA